MSASADTCRPPPGISLQAGADETAPILPAPDLLAPDGMVVRLRVATRSAHKDMETVPALIRVLAPDLTVDEYIAVLRQAGAFYLALHLQLKTMLPAGAPAQAFLEGARLQALTADLAFFGIHTLSPAPAAGLPALATEAAAVGALYVVEGSDLGGRVIAKRLSDSLALTPETGGRFYGGHDADTTRVRWLRFCDLLRDTAAGDETTAATVVAGALATFRSLETWMRWIPTSRPDAGEGGSRKVGLRAAGSRTGGAVVAA